MTAPVAAADAALCALSCELWTISNLLRAADARELEIDDVGLAAALSRYWCIVTDITGTVASTERGRIAKLRAAQVAMSYEEAAPKRITALVRSALHDTLASWEEARSRDRSRP